MRDAKKKRIAAKGWRVGEAAEFLGLTPEESAYIELRLKLADGLRERRKQRGLTQVELAETLASSQSRVAKMEAGDATVTIDLLVRSLFSLGTSSRELAAMIARR